MKRRIEKLALFGISLFFLVGLVFVAIFTFPFVFFLLALFCPDPLPYTRGGRWKLGP